jgi:pyruvate,water dikinase
VAAVRALHLGELRDLVRQQRPARPVAAVAERSRGLPSAFRLAEDGTPVAVVDGVPSAGAPVGGGVGRGRVRLDPADAEPGTVLVVSTLDPRLASVIPVLSGLVAETGSPLSHLAILAREHGVPTVVSRVGATAEFEANEWIEVDGATGAIRRLASVPEAGPAELGGAA